MKLYVYENHLGGLYFDTEYNEGYLRLCETCWDSDIFLGSFESADELIEDLIDEDGYLMYEPDYIKEEWAYSERMLSDE